jgi:tetraacyldisaccharide 4'-kinase
VGCKSPKFWWIGCERPGVSCVQSCEDSLMDRTPLRGWGVVFQVILKPLAWVYGFCGAVRQRYQARKAQQASYPVISIGNVVMGGAGKTPVVIALCRLLKEMGAFPVVVSRGYGRRNIHRNLRVTSEMLPEWTGEEALFISKHVPVYLSRLRKDALAMIDKDFLHKKEANSLVIVLDDGHQHESLKKDLQILVFDAHQGVGNGFVFPMGPLRESLKNALDRAQGIFWIHSLGVVGTQSVTPHILKQESGALSQLGESDHPKSNSHCSNSDKHGKTDCLDQPLSPDDQEDISLDLNSKGQSAFFSLKPEISVSLPWEAKIFAFCGLGFPEKFLKTLEAKGFRIVGSTFFSDHHHYKTSEIASLQRQAYRLGAYLVTTEKDYFNIPKEFRKSVIPVQYWVEFESPAGVENWIKNTLSEKFNGFSSKD